VQIVARIAHRRLHSGRVGGGVTDLPPLSPPCVGASRDDVQSVLRNGVRCGKKLTCNQRREGTKMSLLLV
jgi:hypothetical protein